MQCSIIWIFYDVLVVSNVNKQCYNINSEKWLLVCSGADICVYIRVHICMYTYIFTQKIYYNYTWKSIFKVFKCNNSWLTSHKSIGSSPSCFTSNTALLRAWKSSGIWPRFWSPCTHVGDPKQIPGFELT